MDTPIIYKGETSQSSKKTIEINDCNVIIFSVCNGLVLASFILSIILIPDLLGKILCLVITVIVLIISLYCAIFLAFFIKKSPCEQMRRFP